MFERQSGIKEVQMSAACFVRVVEHSPYGVRHGRQCLAPLFAVGKIPHTGIATRVDAHTGGNNSLAVLADKHLALSGAYKQAQLLDVGHCAAWLEPEVAP